MSILFNGELALVVSGIVKAALSGFFGKGCCGGGAGGWEKGDAESTFAEGEMPLSCASTLDL